jgi:D-alanine-D-alanine ligase-like ATP-grasp enzyme
MKQAFATPILAKLAREMGLAIDIEPNYRYAGQVTLPNGTKKYFLRTCFDLNPLGASEIAKDKDYASFFLKRMGYKTLDGEAFLTWKWSRTTGIKRNPVSAYAYACRSGFPVIVKPNSLSQGTLVCLVHNKAEFMGAVRRIAEKDRVFLVQPLFQGRDYRIVVLDDQIVSAYERTPLKLTGDGRSSIKKLLMRKQITFRRQGRDTTIKFDDFRIAQRLRRLGFTTRSVLAKGQDLTLLANANLSCGGDAHDVMRQMHGSFRELATNVVRDMGLRYCGVDILVRGDIRDPVSDYRIIEINAAPGLDNYAMSGLQQKRNVEHMYRQVLEKLCQVG